MMESTANSLWQGVFFFTPAALHVQEILWLRKKMDFPIIHQVCGRVLWVVSSWAFIATQKCSYWFFYRFFFLQKKKNRIMKRIMGWGERFISIILLFCCPQERTIWWRKIDLCWFSAQLQTGRLTTLIKGRMMEGFGPDLDMEILKHPNTISMVTNRCSRHLNLEECDPIWPKQSQIPFFSAARWWVILHDTNM